MSKVLVKWNRPNVMSVGVKGLATGMVMFKPGPNEFTQKQWDSIKDHPTVKERLKEMVIDPKRGKVPMIELVVEKKADSNSGGGDDNESAISALNAGDAKALVEETYSTDLLREWGESETRKGVLTAVENQLKKIEAERVEKEKDEGSQE